MKKNAKRLRLRRETLQDLSLVSGRASPYTWPNATLFETCAGSNCVVCPSLQTCFQCQVGGTGGAGTLDPSVNNLPTTD